MTQDETIRMAKKAWAESGESWVKPEWFEDRAAAFERFAQLARADEREQMAQDGWRQCAKGQRTTQFCGQLQQAVEAEREACAKLVDYWEARQGEHSDAIRARGRK